MTASVMYKTPQAKRITDLMNSKPMRIERIVFATRKTVVYTIHNTISEGVSCKEKKPIENLKFLCCRLSLKYYYTIYNNDLFKYYSPICVQNI